MFGTDAIREIDLPLFEVQTILDKGKGLIARFNITRGTRILHERPLFTTPNLSLIGQMESSVAAKLKSLSKSQQRQFLSLHNNFPGKHPFNGVIKTNALPCGPNSVIDSIYPTICFINHSCLLNAHHSRNSDIKNETIHAIRYINAGEEITISYDKGGPSDSRRIYLQDAFGFDCNYSVCSFSLPEIQISDARRLQIQYLNNAIGDPNRVMNRPDHCLADYHSLLRVFEEEYHRGAGALIARLYYDAF